MSRITNEVLNPDNQPGTLSLVNVTGTTISRVVQTISKAEVVCTTSADATAELRTAERADAAEGESWFALLELELDVAVAAARSFRWVIVFRNGTTLLSIEYVDVVLTPGQVRSIGVQGIAPAGTTKVDFQITRRATGASGDVFYVRGMGLIQSDTLPPYSTPSYSRLWAWEGTPGASRSYRMTAETTLTPFADMDPCPRVQIEQSDLNPFTASVTVYQVVDGVMSAVAGAEAIPGTPSGLVLTDYYPPLGVEFEYRTEMFDENGLSLEFTAGATVLVDFVGTVISSPNEPALSVEVDLDAAAGSVLAEPFSGKVHQIGDRRILIASGGTGLESLNMDFWTDTIAQYRLVVAILKASKGLVVVRSSYPMEVPPVLFLWLPESERTQTNLPGGVEEFKFEHRGQQVSPPTARIVFAVLTFRRFHLAYPTFRDFALAYDTFREAMLNPPPEV